METIQLPKLAITMEEGTVVRWLKREGDPIAKGEPVVEIETEKANAEIESTCGGYLKRIAVKEGETAPVEAVLAYIAGDEAELKAPYEPAVPEPKPKAQPVSTKPSPKVPPRVPAARPKGPVRAAPAARRLARELGLDLASVQGSGPGGRILPADVHRAKAAAAQTPKDPLEKRKPIIATLTKSIQSIPHIHICRELAADGLIAVKQRNRDVTYTEILLKALALAVEEFPAFKTSLVDGRLYRPKTTSLGFVVDVEDALVIPTIEDPANKSIQDLAAEVRGLTRRARQGKLKHTEVSGATVTLSNLGMHEVDFFTAVIPYGQVAVLTTGRIRYQPALHEGSLVEVPRLWANLTVDHRLIDGAVAAKFLKTLANLLRDGSGVF
ncbi:MAG: dihydrolipoamide acetyltransferase family protein [Candidatus Aminicenantes bacterium]|nr:dihydrolipoamide acetyltransferase family protein [Candidatus Aminicenantes bacterium]